MSLRQSQSALHGWCGLLVGWLVFVVFVAGTVAFYREGLNRWMRPELARVEQPMRVLAGAQRFLEQRAPDARSWSIAMPGTETPGAAVTWRPEPGGEAGGRGRNRALIGAQGVAVTPRETLGGDFFHQFHFNLYYMPGVWARWLVGVAAMVMLVALLTGIVTHKRMFRDFFVLRRGKGQRSWLDGHLASAVLALPFHLMITYTGLVTLMVALLPWVTVAGYADGSKYYEALYPAAPPVERSGRPMPLVDLTALVRDAERRLGGRAGHIEVSDPGDGAARVTVSRAGSSMLSARGPKIAYDGVTGKMVWQSPPPGGASVTAGAMVGLHAGRFADGWLRLIYFLCGVAGSVMVASGLVMWTVKRRARLADPARPDFGFHLVERLNITAIAGFPLGVAAMLWANRLLPDDMAGRAVWEVHSLFIAWAAALIFALVRRPSSGWVGLFGLTGALLFALPLYNMLATERGLIATLPSGDRMLAGIDVGLMVFGVAFVAIAGRIARHGATIARVRPRRVLARPLRALGWAVVAVALPITIAAQGWVFGPIWWMGVLISGAALVFLALNLIPVRSERGQPPAL